MADPDVPSWGLHNEVQVAVLLDAAQRMMVEGDFEGAVGVAEELLDGDPADVDALLLVADAAPRYGHGEVGVLAARQARALGAESTVLEAAALLAACDLEAALALADTHLGAHPVDARAHAVRGQALEALARVPEADDALARAHALRPDAYPLPLAVAADEWDGYLLQALSGLEAGARQVTNTWRFVLVPAPAVEVLRRSVPPIPPSVLALSREDDDGVTCELFTRALTRGCDTDDELVERMRSAIVDELRHRAP